MKTKKERIAWATGFFEGEGWVGKVISYTLKQGKRKKVCWGYRALVVQKDRSLLVKFQKFVGFGKVAGPYRSKNPVCYWRISSLPNVIRLNNLIGKHLSKRRQKQFKQTLGEHYKNLHRKPVR